LLFGAPKIRLLGQARRKQGKEVGKREKEREREEYTLMVERRRDFESIERSHNEREGGGEALGREEKGN